MVHRKGPSGEGVSSFLWGVSSQPANETHMKKLLHQENGDLLVLTAGGRKCQLGAMCGAPFLANAYTFLSRG